MHFSRHQKRAEVFTELLNKGDVANVTADTTNTDQLIRLLDTVVIKLEGGTDDDLKVLDEKPIVILPPAPKPSEEKKEETTDAEGEKKSADESAPESKKRRRTHTDSSSSSSDSESENEESKEKPSNGNGPEEDESKNGNDDEISEQKEDAADAEMKDVAEDDKPEIADVDVDADEEKKVDEVVDLVEEDSTSKKLEELHKTSSIFVRNLAPTITKAEVEALCKRYDGFLRVAIADPAVERRWFRRGWITFKRDVNIKEYCWNLNNIRLRDCELAPIVNRDLSRRVRPVNGITAHKTVCKNDIKLCAKIAHSLDEKSSLWKDSIDENEEKKTFGLQSKNPVLKNITDYLIEEADAEEEELLGMSGENKEEAEGEFLDRDPELVSVLDRIIFYLRIVHSVDFYSEYRNLRL
jgi:SERRATE/Ars2, N-terminal domain